MSSINQKAEAFCLKNSSPEHEILQAVRRDTWVNVLYPQMLTHELQGKFLFGIAASTQAKRILEIGTFTGYSALCFALGSCSDCHIVTIEKNAELENRIQHNLSRTPEGDKVKLLLGSAEHILKLKNHPLLNEPFDIVYIDADKENYPLYLALTYDMLKSGGILLADNVFWGGHLLEESKTQTRESSGLQNFLAEAGNYAWQQHFIVPFSDGLFMGVK